MSLASHMSRVKPLPRFLSRLAFLSTISVLFQLCKGLTPSDQGLRRIGGGTEAPEGRFPYICSIRRRGNQNHLCGGTLVDPSWVMTAAHCIDPNIPESAGKSPLIYCGIHQRTDRIVSKRFGVRNCYIHHLWTGNVLEGNDIALCELDGVSAGSIPDLVSPGDAFGRLDLFSVLGWGTAKSGTLLADVLQIGSGLRFVPDSICNREKEWAGRIAHSMICAGFNNPSTCKGDSGGPLLVPDKFQGLIDLGDSTVDLIVGITSFGDRACDQSVPGVYTRVSCYRPWISCIMEGKAQDCKDLIPCEEKSGSCPGVSRSSNFDEANALNRINSVIQSDDSGTVKEILCQGLSPNAIVSNFKNSLLMIAAQYDAVKSAQVLLQQGANLEYRNSYGQTALSRAARYGSARVAQLFIDKRANIESKTNNGWTALYYAARYNHLQIAQILIENEAKLESKTNTGWTPLHTTAFFNLLVIAKVLITAGANADSVDNRKWTPLHLAAQEGSLEVAKELIVAGSDINSKTANQLTPLYLAAQHESIEVAKELITAGAIITSTRNDGFAPLHIAAQRESIQVAKELIAAGAELSSRTNKGFTPLHLTAQYNTVEIAKELLSNNAELEARTNVGSSPLHIASYHGSFDVLQMLLDEEAMVESVNNKKQTPLHFASSRGHVSVVRVLLLNGASKTSTDNDGKTPLDVIRTNQFLEKPCTNNIINAIRRLLET